MTRHYPRRVSPFGNPRIIAWLAAPRGFSQLPTSFIASRHLGIRRTPFLAWSPSPLTPARRDLSRPNVRVGARIILACLNAFTFAVMCFSLRMQFSKNVFPNRGEPGGAGRNRTDDPLLAKQVLYQLSYSPEFSSRPSTEMVGLGRLELPTSRLSGVRSNQLSYRPKGRRTLVRRSDSFSKSRGFGPSKPNSKKRISPKRIGS